MATVDINPARHPYKKRKNNAAAIAIDIVIPSETFQKKLR